MCSFTAPRRDRGASARPWWRSASPRRAARAREPGGGRFGRRPRTLVRGGGRADARARRSREPAPAALAGPLVLHELARHGFDPERLAAARASPWPGSPIATAEPDRGSRALRPAPGRGARARPHSPRPRGARRRLRASGAALGGVGPRPVGGCRRAGGPGASSRRGRGPGLVCALGRGSWVGWGFGGIGSGYGAGLVQDRKLEGTNVRKNERTSKNLLGSRCLRRGSRRAWSSRSVVPTAYDGGNNATGHGPQPLLHEGVPFVAVGAAPEHAVGAIAARGAEVGVGVEDRALGRAEVGELGLAESSLRRAGSAASRGGPRGPGGSPPPRAGAGRRPPRARPRRGGGGPGPGGPASRPGPAGSSARTSPRSARARPGRRRRAPGGRRRGRRARGSVRCASSSTAAARRGSRLEVEVGEPEVGREDPAVEGEGRLEGGLGPRARRPPGPASSPIWACRCPSTMPSSALRRRERRVWTS